MREYDIAVIGADGIGPEVINAGVEVLKVLEQRSGGFRLRFESFDWGSDYYRRHGRMMPEDGLELLAKKAGYLFRRRRRSRAAGRPDALGPQLKICQGFDQFANVRPTRILPGIASPLAGAKPAISTG